MVMTQNVQGCLKCGQCCYLIDGKDKITDIPCRFLDLKTKLCKVYYRNRIGRIIGVTPDGKRNRCIYRRESLINYAGCPFNK